jgi:hypothetical protein
MNEPPRSEASWIVPNPAQSSVKMHAVFKQLNSGKAREAAFDYKIRVERLDRLHTFPSGRTHLHQ